uniref:NADP-dependent oxidoreductase domain-containing protein n=1 Tax=Calcidiscus leptoporus TaxID=127549 RepID=A0A7S0NP81_9EUKA|mmetsp:Transcript_11968/g.27727  ORF Transcript_11968/g.27727 Transcript_11968/m.27727 type:complete len:354 (+) Transcript_11968:3-1064(+)
MAAKRKADDQAAMHFSPASSAGSSSSLCNCARLAAQAGTSVLMPWIGVGTYKMANAQEAVGAALQIGYRHVETAFIYSGEKTETEVGKALATALEGGLRRDEVFVTTKHWRAYHGFEPALACLQKSLRRLQLSHVDLWLMHWPGPAYTTMNRRKDLMEEHGPWHYAATSEAEMPAVRAATWRAMEHALGAGQVRAIGVSNFSIRHLETLKRTATVWPPAVNQVEMHPLYPQKELLEYCRGEGIVVQAYASLGGQDASKKTLAALGGPLLTSPPVVAAAADHDVSAAQVLLRWALQKGAAVIPKASSQRRLLDNARLFHFHLTDAEVLAIDELDRGDAGRLCWRNDPLRMLDWE